MNKGPQFDKAVKLERKEYEALRAIAKENGQYISYLLTQAVRQYVESQSKAKSQVA